MPNLTHFFRRNEVHAYVYAATEIRSCFDSLEELEHAFRCFNNIEGDSNSFLGRSAMAGDIFVLIQGGAVSVYRTESQGFKDVTERYVFDPLTLELTHRARRVQITDGTSVEPIREIKRLRDYFTERYGPYVNLPLVQCKEIIQDVIDQQEMMAKRKTA